MLLQNAFKELKVKGVTDFGIQGDDLKIVLITVADTLHLGTFCDRVSFSSCSCL
jgi:hypothetical protein